MRRSIFAAAFGAALVFLSGTPVHFVLCRHVDGTSQIESGEHRCCGGALGAERNGGESVAGVERDACPGCADTLLPSGAAAAQASKSPRLTMASVAFANTQALVASPLPHLKLARPATRDPVLSRATPLLI